MRIKRGFKARRRRNKVLKRAKGYYSQGSRSYTIAIERNDRALAYAYRDRKTKKREFRALWIQRINAAVRPFGLSYSVFMGKVIKSGIALDRKTLADIAARDADGFSAIVKQVQNA